MSDHGELAINPVGFFRIDQDDPEFSFRDRRGRRPIVKVEQVDHSTFHFGNKESDEAKAFSQAKAAAEDFMLLHGMTPVDPATLARARKDEEPTGDLPEE